MVWYDIMPDKTHFRSRVFEVLEYIAVKYADYPEKLSIWQRTIEKPLQKIPHLFGM